MRVKQNRQMRAKHPIIQLSITQVSLLFTCAKRVMAKYPWTDLHWAMGCIPVKSVTHPQPSNQPEAIMLNSNDLTQIRLKLGGGVGQDDPCPKAQSATLPYSMKKRTNTQ